jgi:hypothetical protein
MNTTLACPDCRAPMARLDLPGHYGVPVQLDHCDACRQLWFDPGEFGRLGHPAWIQLLQRLAEGAGGALGAPNVASSPGCPVCRRGLQPVHDQTVYGRFKGLQCPAQHGRVQRDATLFASRGLFRRLVATEREVLGDRLGPCMGCGAPSAPGDDDCAYCATPPLVIDLARLSQSLGLSERRSTLGQGSALRWDCQGCGLPVDAVADSTCSQCGHPVVALGWAALGPLLAQAATTNRPQFQAKAQAEALMATRSKAERPSAVLPDPSEALDRLPPWWRALRDLARLLNRWV